jgi:predicted ATPase
MEYTTRDLICLSIDAVDVPETGPVPETITVPGLTDALELGGSAAARVELLAEIEYLNEAGILRKEVRPVRDTGTDRNAYLLTDDGTEKARSLREDLHGKTVTLTNGTNEEISLDAIGRYLDTPALVRALARLTPNGTVPLEEFHGDQLVGRRDELDQLLDSYDSLQTRGGHAMLVTGESGVGKSTLIDQFLSALASRDDEPITAQGECDRDTSQAYSVFRTAFDDLPIASALHSLLPEGLDSDEDPELVQQRRQAFFADVSGEIRELAGQKPVVFVFEDLHWADRPTIDLFVHLIDALGQWVYPVLFVGTYRAEAIDEMHPVHELEQKLTGTDHHERLELEPLGITHTRDVLCRTLETETVPDGFVETVHSHTGGNPLFVEETARQFVEMETVDISHEEYPTNETDLPTPETVAHTVDDRLAVLDATGSELVGLGAVIGESFPVELLRAASELPEPQLLDYVDLLVESRIWERDGETLSFVHGVVREAALDRLDDDTETRFHTRIASILESSTGDVTTDEKQRRLAHHYHESGQFEKAIDASLQAARRASELFAHEVTIESAKQARELADELDDKAASLEAQELLGDTYTVTGEFDQAVSCFRDVRTRTESREDTQRLWRKEGTIEHKRGEFETAREYLQKSLELARDREALFGEAKALQQLGFVAEEEGDFEAARDSLDSCLEMFRQLDDRLNEAMTLRNLGNVALREGDFSTARERYQGSLDIFESLEDRHGTAKTMANLGLVERREGNFETAREHLQESLELLEELGDRYGQAINLNNLAELAHREGKFERAREYHERSLDIERSLGNRHGEAISRDNLGEIAQRVGEFDAARDYHEESLELRRELGDRHGEAISLANLGAVAQKTGNYETAREYLDEALAIARDIGDRHSEATCLYNLGLVADATDALDAATEYYQESLAIFEELGDEEFSATVQGFLGAVEIRRGDIESGREKRTDACADVSEMGAVPTELRILRCHIEAEREGGSGEEVSKLCHRARSCVDETEASLGYEHQRIETLCDSVAK